MIGDKKGGRTSLLINRDPSSIKQLKQLKEIAKNLGVPMKFIHVVGNPFDNIATMVLRGAGERDNVREEGAKVS